MANSFIFNDKTYKVGDMIDVDYKIKEADKERLQKFKGILIKIKGANNENRMITVRKMSNSGIGVERIIPISSPYIAGIKLVRKSNYQKAKLYFVRNLSDQELRTRLYQTKIRKPATRQKKTS